MLRKLLPLILLLLGTGAGIGAGILTAPAHPGEVYAPEAEEESHGSDGHGETSGQAHDFVKLNNQFVVPLIQGDKRRALRRMKAFPLGLLIGAAVIFVVAWYFEKQPGSPVGPTYERCVSKRLFESTRIPWSGPP